MPLRLTDPRWSDRQRAFLNALDDARATKPDDSKPLGQLPTLSGRDLQSLIDAGIVREASSNGYYLYHRQTRPDDQSALASVVADMRNPGPFSANVRARLTKSVAFWIIMIAIPVALIECTGRR